MAGIIVRNLSDQLVDLIRERILDGTVPPGQPIRQDALASELGVSKIPLREALTRLEQEGLVTSQVNRGYVVRSLRSDEAEEVYALRLKLEPETVALAAIHANDADRQQAIQASQELDAATNVHGAGVGAFNRTFHLALIRPSGQATTTLFLERLHILSERYVRKHLEPLGRDQRANEEHGTILQMWLDRDTLVGKLVQAHIRKTVIDLRRELSRQSEN
ncbi:GntR family transcriptional regulator [Qipengyuania qiaonensis]|uniref:GntR family transcriptional regulator n=1 Tax=Qipengyuania qiaonensis TaxID=2867240 RepID=A0ABS7J7Y6_9SPHN|nr:GntR family transcriptional regulator [Qipengyuania qiaonensis]MBX7483430.1 GntR family transcriptional regulator [Qipengyuania qiaonensis]